MRFGFHHPLRLHRNLPKLSARLDGLDQWKSSATDLLNAEFLVCDRISVPMKPLSVFDSQLREAASNIRR